MSPPGLRRNQNVLLAAAFIVLFITVLCFYLYRGVLQSAGEIIEDNKNITRTAVHKLVLIAEKDLYPVWNKYLSGKNKIIKQEERLADSLLSDDVKQVLSNFYRLEGGFYFYELDEFIGYSFPTIEDPKPAFGPPPRSYNIIRNQARTTVQNDSLLTKLHKFDPAVFPLSTQPVYVDGELVGAAWARVHIERKLSTSQNIQSGTFFLTLGGILLGFFIVILVVWTFGMRMREIKEGLQRMKQNPSFRLKEYKGVLGAISRLINEMTDTRQKEQETRKKLERELFQKEKMATLGNLVAGTAHEINTPISIIKTRIQIWERKLRKSSFDREKESLINDKSLKMVHNEIDRLSTLVKRLLVFSKPTNDKKVAIDLHEMLDEKLCWLEEAFPSHEISFKTQWDVNMPQVFADKSAINQVLINILKNAVEASAESCRIMVSTHYSENKELAEIRIRDFGPGMPDEIKPKIFDPFFSTKNNGSGLGLSICNEIIKAHHGSIHFEKPKEGLRHWNQNTNIENIESIPGTVCIITLPTGQDTKIKY